MHGQPCLFKVHCSMRIICCLSAWSLPALWSPVGKKEITVFALCSQVLCVAILSVHGNAHFSCCIYCRRSSCKTVDGHYKDAAVFVSAEMVPLTVSYCQSSVFTARRVAAQWMWSRWSSAFFGCFSSQESLGWQWLLTLLNKIGAVRPNFFLSSWQVIVW